MLNLRQVFSDLGVHVQFGEGGSITTHLDDKLVDAINKGQLKQYLAFSMQNTIDESFAKDFNV